MQLNVDGRRAQEVLPRHLPREQLILRPAMLLLLAVRFEHVMEAMALICEIGAHSKSSSAVTDLARCGSSSTSLALILYDLTAPVMGLATHTP